MMVDCCPPPAAPQIFGLLVQAEAGMVFWSYLLFFIIYFFSKLEVLVMKDMRS